MSSNPTVTAILGGIDFPIIIVATVAVLVANVGGPDKVEKWPQVPWR